MVQPILDSFQRVHKEDALPILMVALVISAIGHKAAFARSIVAGKYAALLNAQKAVLRMQKVFVIGMQRNCLG